MNHDQAAKLLYMLESNCGCKVHPVCNWVNVICPLQPRPSDEVICSIQKLKPELIQILEGRRKCAELQERLKQLRSGANG